MTYLIVGLDRRTLAPWHRNVLERRRGRHADRRRARERGRVADVDAASEVAARI
jgi:hypothetical protein